MIADWLASIGLKQYAAAFIAENIEPDVLADLTDADLESLGVTLGHRKRILRAVAEHAHAEAISGTPATGTSAVTAMSDVGERRQITVAFVDLVGSTALAARLDPEDLRNVIVAYHRCCAEIVSSFEGDVAQYLGDGVMIEFGYPFAHEDDAERAVRCALAIVASVRDLALPGGVRLIARVGIATGTEVVGDQLRATRDRASVVGTTPSLASRYQSLAAPGCVVIGTQTRPLLGDAFLLTPLGRHDVKGVDAPAELWRVDAERPASSRFAARAGATTGLFVGRDLELQLLLERCLMAAGGEGQAVLLSGDAGVGKSRILEEFIDRMRSAQPQIVRLQCSPSHAASALYPLAGYVERSADIAPTDEPATRVAKLEAFVAQSSRAERDDVDALASLLAIPGAEDRPTLRGLTTDQRKARLFRTVLDRLAASAARQLVLFIVEDAHWIDPTTLEFVTRVIEDARAQRIFVLATARPQFSSPWAHHGHLTTFALNRLGRNSVEAIVRDLCGHTVLPPDLLARIVERTDGIPLFAEELTRTILDSAVDAFTERAIPMTLRDALAARLDSLGRAREVAQIGAVIGREFSEELLAAIAGLLPEQLGSALNRLVESGLVLRVMKQRGAAYSFKHALVRDAAYESLLRQRRQQLHLTVAQAIVSDLTAIADAEPETAAYHFEEGEAFSEAIVYWRRAADLAISRSAYREAVSHLHRALLLAKHLPNDAATRQEVEIANRLGVMHFVLDGGMSPAARTIYERNVQLTATFDEDTETFAARWGLCFSDYITGRMLAAREHASDLVSLAERLDDEDLLLEALHARWAAAFFIGDVRMAMDAAMRGSAIYSADRHHVHVTRFGSGHDSGVCCLTHGAVAHYFAGQFSAGDEWLARGLALARRLGHPFSLTHGLQTAMLAYDLIGDFERALDAATECLAHARAGNFAMSVAVSQLVAGAATIGLGDRAGGIAIMERVLDVTTGPDPAGWRPYYLTRLGTAHLDEGNVGEARVRFDLARTRCDAIGGAFGDPEVDRVRARLDIADGAATSVARVHLDAAIARARATGALLLELRATSDLVELLPDGADATRARDELGTLLKRIKGGAELRDVRRAHSFV